MLYVIQAVVIFFSLSVHEAAHAWMANKLGDPTARMLGRITLNPIPHIDPVGTVLVPFIMIIMGVSPIGWAKPVPYNPYNLRNPRRDSMLISAAGPGSNLIIAGISIVIFLLIKSFMIQYYVVFLFLISLIIINILLAVFNLIPFPPLDGGGIVSGFLRGDALRLYEQIRPYGFVVVLVIVYSGALDLIFNPLMSFIYTILGVR